MKRVDILEKFDDEQHVELEELINHFEQQFKDIYDLLSIESVEGLPQIAEAKDLAEKIAAELY